jgi:uncharacterized protein DUF3306
MVDEENFLKRWSRRKLEKAREEPAAAPAPADRPQPPPAGAVTGASHPAPAELPAVDSLRGLASDYKEFLNPQVDENLRRSALKKLFHDPHFNVMDGLDVYIDDYSKPDPIPESMLKGLLERHRSITEIGGEHGPDEAPAAKEPPPPAAAQPALAEAPRPEAPAPGAADGVPAPAQEEKPT